MVPAGSHTQFVRHAYHPLTLNYNERWCLYFHITLLYQQPSGYRFPPCVVVNFEQFVKDAESGEPVAANLF